MRRPEVQGRALARSRKKDCYFFPLKNLISRTLYIAAISKAIGNNLYSLDPLIKYMITDSSINANTNIIAGFESLKSFIIMLIKSCIFKYCDKSFFRLNITSRLREVEFLRQPTKIQFGRRPARRSLLIAVMCFFCKKKCRLKGGTV